MGARVSPLAKDPHSAHMDTPLGAHVRTRELGRRFTFKVQMAALDDDGKVKFFNRYFKSELNARGGAFSQFRTLRPATSAPCAKGFSSWRGRTAPTMRAASRRSRSSPRRRRIPASTSASHDEAASQRRSADPAKDCHEPTL